jgi:hypothetical protein
LQASSIEFALHRKSEPQKILQGRKIVTIYQRATEYDFNETNADVGGFENQ